MWYKKGIHSFYQKVPKKKKLKQKRRIVCLTFNLTGKQFIITSGASDHGPSDHPGTTVHTVLYTGQPVQPR